MRRFGFLLLVGLPGCMPCESKVPVHPVDGKLIILGHPAADATLAFHAVDPHRTGGQCPVGMTQADGSFRLMTYTKDDGAPAGEYIITLYWPADPLLVHACACSDQTTHDRLFGRYANPATSELRAVVRPGSNTIVVEATADGGHGWNTPPAKRLP